jgi:uncharacterized protein YjiS (DUF1127 family)
MLKHVIDLARAALPWRRLLPALVRWRQERRYRRETRLLDRDALRDLGLDGSELGSCAAEASGAAACTRRRVAAVSPPAPVRMDGLPAAVRRASYAGSHGRCVRSALHLFSMETVMPKYVIERAIPALGALQPAELQAVAQKSCSVLRDLGPDVQWVHSYVTGDKMYCIYNAANEGLVREHARRGGFPADSVARVVSIVDPTSAEA